MDCDLVCNFRKCRKRLNTNAWVTSCSHIFCDDDGSREFNKSYTCPACETSLSGTYDIIRIDLQQSEKYKTMVLAGQKPETVIEIASRALAFWTYQIHQERTYQEFVMTKGKERNIQMEQYYEQILARTTAELTTLKTQLATTKKELESVKKKFTEASEQIQEKGRQYHKLQMLYDALRRKCITPSTFDIGDIPVHMTTRNTSNFDLPLNTRESILRRDSNTNATTTVPRSPAEREFVLRPGPTPIPPVATPEGCAAAQSRFHLHIETPNRGMSRPQ
ncbi:E3 ubiquitin-protein ligase CCNB1IP1 [Lamellibrachia satsuma]|nr:E3 ubiquitin-protein ligase CCNB1IP1 [Lamellibrachia satsuma]